MKKQIEKGRTQVYDAIVLGGGLAGLACADETLRSSKKKRKVILLEKNSYLGGLSTTIVKDSFRFDLAPHRWFTKNQELNEWIDELMKREMIWVNKYTPIYQHDKFFEYPVKIGDILKKIGPVKALFMLISYTWARINKKVFKKKTTTMKDAYINRFGYALYKWFNEEYNNKLWGENGCELMSADFVDQRVKDLSMITAIKNALGINKNKVISLVPRFRFPELGIGRISDNLEERIKKNGGKILRRTVISGIRRVKDKYQVITNRGTFITNNLVSSIPIDELLKLLEPAPPKKIIQAIDQLSYVHQKIVVLLAKKPRLTNFTWVYVHPPKIKFFRFLETNNWSTKMSPHGKTSLVFEYPYHSEDKVEKMKDKDLVSLTIKDFIKYFSPKTRKSDFIKGYVFSVPKAYPKYDLKYKNALDLIMKYFKRNHPKLQLIGRNGRFHYNNMDHSIYTGILAAKIY